MQSLVDQTFVSSSHFFTIQRKPKRTSMPSRDFGMVREVEAPAETESLEKGERVCFQDHVSAGASTSQSGEFLAIGEMRTCESLTTSSNASAGVLFDRIWF
jgi:hypothetical protein